MSGSGHGAKVESVGGYNREDLEELERVYREEQEALREGGNGEGDFTVQNILRGGSVVISNNVATGGANNEELSKFAKELFATRKPNEEESQSTSSSGSTDEQERDGSIGESFPFCCFEDGDVVAEGGGFLRFVPSTSDAGGEVPGGVIVFSGDEGIKVINVEEEAAILEKEDEAAENLRHVAVRMRHIDTEDVVCLETIFEENEENRECDTPLAGYLNEGAR